LFSFSLGEAAGDDDLSDSAFLFLADGVVNRVQCFGLCGGDEAACIDNDDIGGVGVLGYTQARLGDLGKHALAVNHIFWTAQRYKADGYPFFVPVRIHWSYHKMFDGYNKDVILSIFKMFEK